MTNPPDLPAPQPSLGVPGPLAEWADRVVAFLIDLLFVAAAGLAVAIVVGVIGVISDALAALVGALGYAAIGIASYYFGYLDGTKGQSPGKAIRGLKVVKISDGQVLGGGMGVIRKLAHIIDGIICGIGYLFPLWDPNKQTIADKIVQTVVLKDQERKPFSQELFLP